MKQEDKELLLKDLCARLPYNIMVDYESHIYILNEIDPSCKDIDYITIRIQDVKRLMCAKNVMIEDIKPYLRPMSSMTEEEAKELSILYGFKDILSAKITDKYVEFVVDDGFCSRKIWYEYDDIISSIEIVDWLNAHYFDYRGLIPNGLAIAVTEENNPYKE